MPPLDNNPNAANVEMDYNMEQACVQGLEATLHSVSFSQSFLPFDFLWKNCKFVFRMISF